MHLIRRGIQVIHIVKNSYNIRGLIRKKKRKEKEKKKKRKTLTLHKLRIKFEN